MKMKKGTAYGLSALIVLGYLAVAGFLVLSNVSPVFADSGSGGGLGGQQECWETTTGLVDCNACCMSELSDCQINCDLILYEDYESCDGWYSSCLASCDSDLECELDCEIEWAGCKGDSDDAWDGCYDGCDLSSAGCFLGCNTKH